MAVLDLVRFFSRKSHSKDVAKERLQILLVHDKAGVSPELLSMMQKDLMSVLLKYIDIPEDSLNFQLTQTQSDDGFGMVPALVASIPISSMKKRENQT